MLGIYIGLLAVADALSPGREYPKLIVLTPCVISFALDVLLIVHLCRR